MSKAGTGVLEVAVGVIVSANREVLIARRPDHVHQGGLFEFPGGKLEPSETSLEALRRELREELGIRVTGAAPLITLRHDYSDRRVLLHVFRVDRYEGEPLGRQGQPISWVPREELAGLAFPEANRPIVTAARLPDRYAILDAPTDDAGVLMDRLCKYADRGIDFVRLRASRLGPDQYLSMARQAAGFCAASGITLLINGPPERVAEIGAGGLHLRSDELMKLRVRPLDRKYWLAASCHDGMQLKQAAIMGVDFAVLGPVAATATHPEAAPMGWDAFAGLLETAKLPVYALGGLDYSHLAMAKQRGAQGVAAIRGFLK
jgi:8-oxo-dGTP diphosphatase